MAGHIHFTGSIKWLNSPFDTHDLTTLRHAAAHIPGYAPEHTGLVVVSRSGVTDLDGIALTWEPNDIIAAWSSPV